jgi:hypothetical protein
MRQHCGEDSREDDPHKDITEAIIGAAIRLKKALFAQLNSYLPFSSFEVGLLINFHNQPLKTVVSSASSTPKTDCQRLAGVGRDVAPISGGLH